MLTVSRPHPCGKARRFRCCVAALLMILLVCLLCACADGTEKVPQAELLPAADVEAMVAAGDYDGALEAVRHSSMTPEEMTDVTARCYSAKAAQAEAAGDYSTAYGFYISAGTGAEAVDNAARCYAALRINHANELFANGDLYGAYAQLEAFGDRAYADDVAALRSELESRKSEILSARYEKCRDKLAAGAWYTAMLGDASVLAGDGRYDVSALPQDADAVYGGTFGLFYQKDGKLTVYGDTLGAKDTVEALTNVVTCAVAQNHALILTADGLVQTVGSIGMEKGLTAEWTDIVDVAAGAYHSVGLKSDGTCVATGSDLVAQCAVSEWTDVTAVAAGLYHTVGLKKDGTCVATGDNTYGQCDVSGWKDVLAVYCGSNHTVALTKDFTVLATGNNASGQCEVSDWTDIVAVACGTWHTVGVRADGQVAVSGADSNGQCRVSDWRMFDMTACADPIPVRTDGKTDELIYTGEFRLGPWLYLYETGAVMICFDHNEERSPLRSDLYSVAGNVLYGGFVDGGDSPRKTALPAVICRGNDAVFGITGDYIVSDYNPDGIKIRRGKVYEEGGPQKGMAFCPDGTMRFIDSETTTAQEVLDAGVNDVWVFGPILVQNGEVATEEIEAHFLCKYVNPRCSIGMISPYHFVSVVSGWGGVLPMYSLADIYMHYGAECAYNMDGGNSTSVVFMGEMLNYVAFTRSVGAGIRSLHDMILFLKSDAVPGLDEKYVMNRYLAKKP